MLIGYGLNIMNHDYDTKILFDLGKSWWIGIDKTPEKPPSTTNIDTQVAQAYFEEAKTMHIVQVSRSRSKFATIIEDEGLVGSSSSTIRRGRIYVHSHACARVASTRRVITRQATTEAYSVEYDNDDGDQEDENIDNVTVDSSFDSDYVDNYDDTTRKSSNDDVEEEI